MKPVTKGDALTINYSNLPNQDFLMRYGFVVKDNPYNSIPLNLDFTPYMELSS
jgi:hypothetical protein